MLCMVSRHCGVGQRAILTYPGRASKATMSVLFAWNTPAAEPLGLFWQSAENQATGSVSVRNQQF